MLVSEMETAFEVINENPKKNANILSKLMFGWMATTFWNGVKRAIIAKDLFKVLDCDNSELLGNKLEDNWEKEVKRSNEIGKDPSLLRAVSNTFLWHYMVYGVSVFIHFVGLKVFVPIVLGYLIQLFNGRMQVDDPELQKYIAGLMLVVVVVLAIFFYHHNYYGQQCIGMRVRVAMSTLVYRKMLKLNKKSLGNTSAGKVVNLLANDVQRFDYVAVALHYFWVTPFQVALITYLLWNEVAIASLAGILSMLLLTLPIQALLGKQTSKLRAKVAARTDSRVRLMNEIISGVQVIKMYAWEKPFEKVVKATRLNEIQVIRIANYIKGIFLSWTVFMERTTLCITLITFVLMDNILTSDIVFTSAQYFNLLQTALASLLPLAIQMAAETSVSLKRLQEFLLLEEKKSSRSIWKSEDQAIDITNVNGSWSEECQTLHDISFKVPTGKLCAIIGPVGSGKTSILQLLLGEFPINSGIVKLGGNISYSSQEPWLFGSSVKTNILFGQKYDELLYNQIIKVCALEKDFLQFPQGDKTIVGERGVSLSGGQRARINLARAIYREADIYLLDDPLSAVDTHVGKHLFEECIVKYLKSKTRILVTHQLQYLKQADHIIVLNNGKIEVQGTFEYLSKSSSEYTKMLIAADETTEKPEELSTETPPADKSKSIESTENNDDNSEQNYRGEEVSTYPSVATDYIKSAGSICLLFVVCVVLILSQTACSAADYWVSHWTDQEEQRHLDELIGQNDEIDDAELLIKRDFSVNATQLRLFENEEDGFLDTYIAIYIYAGLIIAIILLAIVRSYLFFRSASNASKTLHDRMFNCLLKAPMRFFDTNPSGRVLNRFSKDTGAMDEILPRVLNEALQTVLVMIGSIIMIAIANYWMIIVMVLLALIFAVLRKWFLATARSIKHIEATVKSPVFSTLNSTLNGICTIRAANAQNMLIKQFDNHQNVHTSAWFMLISYMVSFGLWLDMIFVILFACIVFSFVAISKENTVSGAMVGLAVSQALGLTGMVQYGMTQIAEVINQMTSVERVLQYTKIEQEGPFDSPIESRPKSDWPANGKIYFKNVYLRYDTQNEPVLQNLNIDIASGEKIGIVGRTGAGKSSLISALFRLAPLDGTITVDSLNTQLLGLHDVRSKISIIPQEPVLFSSTMRHNLDPFNEFNDTELWNALDEVELKDVVSSLNFEVEERGNNFSVGQRQLICLARAIIRRNKILVLDEATANVDPRTDSLIQTTIRRKFKDCTVLTIAHRLNTIMDSDRIMVMDTGCIVECDHPYVLLQNPNGIFTRLVMETGSTMFASLKKIAQDSYNH